MNALKAAGYVTIKSPLWLRKFQLQEKRETPLKWKTLLVLIGFQFMNKYTIGPYIGPSFAKILNQRIQFGPLPSGTHERIPLDTIENLQFLRRSSSLF